MSHRPAPTLLLRGRVDADLSATSRHEQWEVYDHVDLCKRRHIARQRVHWNADGSHTETLQISLGRWLELCREGNPSALDVMFTPAELVDVDVLGELRSAWRVDAHALKEYRRHAAAAAATFPQGVRARQLAHNLAELGQWGRYEPYAWSRVRRVQQSPIAA